MHASWFDDEWKEEELVSGVVRACASARVVVRTETVIVSVMTIVSWMT